jgi:hypothetical protein
MTKQSSVGGDDRFTGKQFPHPRFISANKKMKKAKRQANIAMSLLSIAVLRHTHPKTETFLLLIPLLGVRSCTVEGNATDTILTATNCKANTHVHSPTVRDPIVTTQEDREGCDITTQRP